MQKEILDLISKDSRLSVEDIAGMLSLDEDTVREEIKKMEEENIICGYPTLVNWERTDSGFVTALIEVKVNPQRDMGFDRVAERISRFTEVEGVYLMSGGFDLTVLVRGKSMQEVARFVAERLSTMEYVYSTKTNFVMRKYKEYGKLMSNGNLGEERMKVTP